MLIFSCAENPDYPITPQISFQSIRFQPRNSGNGESEQIVLWLNFTDGNGDLGLTSADTNIPFNPYVCNIETSRCDTFISYLRKQGVPNNQNFYNFFVEFLLKDSLGVYRNCDNMVECDINQKYNNMLNSYNGRFRDLNDRNSPKPISGSLNYNLSSTLFSTAFKGKTIKLNVYIKDRALNQSNSVLTDSLIF